MPGRDRYSPVVPPAAVAGAVEFIPDDGQAGDDGNWRIDVNTGDFKLQHKESGTWEDRGFKYKGS